MRNIFILCFVVIGLMVGEVYAANYYVDYDITDTLRKEIDKQIKIVLSYIDENSHIFQDLSQIWEVYTDIFNPYSIIKSLEAVTHKTGFYDLIPVIDLSSGPTTANIGLYLFALKYYLN